MKNFPIYITNRKNSQRYAFGTEGDRTLYVMGLNPSGLPDKDMNSTLRNVSAFSKILGFDSFVMLNLYPQRSTDSSNIHKRKSKLLTRQI